MISKRTVETHVQHIYDKLRVNSRVDLLHRLMG
jgi:DNA-binding CsgD family transcriptional regulator